MKTYAPERRLYWVEEKGGQCIKCGSKENLEFDHIDPKTKKYKIANNFHRHDIEEEMSKCQLLCNPCHREKTSMENSPYGHGEGLKGIRSCKCVPCSEKRKAYNRESMRKWRARQ